MKTQVHTFRMRMLTLIVLMIAGSFSTKIFAQKTWIGANNGVWNTPGNWSPTGVPGSTDAVTINTARTISVNISPTITIKSLTISGSVAVTLVPATTGSVNITLSNAGNTALSIATGNTLTLDGTSTGNKSLTLGFSGTGNVATIAGTLAVNGTGNNGFYNAANSSTTISGVLNVNGGSFTAGGTTTISGTANISSGAFTASSGTTSVSGTMNYTGGTITSNTANLNFGSGGLYNHDVDGGTVPTATWNTGSTCTITGNSGIAPSGLAGVSFANFTWNSPSQGNGDDVSLAGNLKTVNGDFSIVSTGSGTLRLLNSGNGGTLSVGGKFIQSGGTFYIVGSGGNSTTETMTVAGSFSVSGGTLRVNGATTGSSGAARINAAGDFSIAGGTITETASNGYTSDIHFNGTTPQTFTSGGTISNTVNFTVDNGATLQMGTGAAPSTISGGGTFTLSTGATLGVTSAAGITSTGATGNILVTGTRSYGTTTPYASFIYNGAAAQATGSGLPATVNNFFVTTTNSSNVSLSNALTVRGTLHLISGTIDASTNSLTMNTGATISGGSAASYVVTGNGSGNGGLTINNVATSGILLPVGTLAYYLPATVTPATGGLNWSAKVFTPAAKNGQYGSTPFSATELQSMVNAIWTITPSTTTTTAALTLDWTSGAALEGSAFAVANSSTYGISHYNGTAWDAATNTGGTTATSVTSTFSSFSPFGIGFAGNPLPVVLVDFNAVLNNDKSVDLSWETQMELNSSRFNALRSADGSNWTSIGTVEAKGNSSVITDYSFNDKNPLSGVNYYRLQMLDIDGHVGYSEVRVVKTTLIAGFSVFPNPAKDYINVSLNASASALTIRLINQSGQVLQERSVNGSSASVVSLAVYSYPQGSYYLQVSSADGSQQISKVLITR